MNIKIDSKYSKQQNSGFQQHFELYSPLYQSAGVIFSIIISTISLVCTIKNNTEQKRELDEKDQRKRKSNLKEQEILFTMKNLENIDKSVFKELVITVGPNVYDLSEVIEVKLSSETKKMRKIDSILTSKSYRVNNAVERAIN